MIAAVSPYHLTSREAAAMAGLVLAGSVVTVRPAPEGGATRERVTEAASRAPSFARLYESWRWTEALWRAGVVRAGVGPAEAAEEVRGAVGLVLGDERYAPLRDLLRREVLEDPERSLDAVARDILRAGPDPGLSVPVAAALDRFAARHGLVVMRSRAVSVAQRAEQKLAEPLAAFALPLPVQGEGEALLAAREMLGGPLRVFREAMAGLVREAGGPGRAAACAGVASAAGELAREVESRRAGLETLAERDRPRVVVSAVTLSVVRLPADAALRSSTTAARALAGGRGGGGGSSAAGSDELEGRWIVSMIVKAL